MLFFSFCVTFCLAFAQNGLTMAEQKALVEKISHDTLPFQCQRLPNQINSPFSEYNPILWNDSVLFFSSMRSEIDDDNESFFDTHWSSMIYQADCRQGMFENVRPISKVINKSNYYHPNFAFNKNHDYMVFSRCLRNTFGELVCDLYDSHLKNGQWQKPNLLGNGINGRDFSSTQPFLAEFSDYSVLYFVSNRPNGQGEMDIWFSILKNGQYEAPINAGTAINTAGNEVTPFYDANASALYFSSDEWLGVGGYDVFVANGGMCSWTKPQNMGVPINSAENDIYFSLADAQGNSGYFSSNRPIDEEHLEDTCCNDIFRWQKIHPDTVVMAEKTDTLTCLIRSVFPITLYFDNDIPDSKTVKDTTSTEYLSLLADYIKSEFLYESHQDSEEGRSWIRHFFQDTLTMQREKLTLLFDFLEKQLIKGKSFKISIEGYASSLHSSDYNMHLSQRRIISLMNELMRYKNGVFVRFMRNGQLKMTKMPMGSLNAQSDGDPVYGKNAVLQRKITLRDIY